MKLRSVLIFISIVLALIFSLGFVTGNPVTIAPAINAVLVVALPLLAGMFLVNRFALSWRLFWIGAATFIASQVLHIPYNSYALEPMLQNLGWDVLPGSTELLIVVLLYGISSGLFEEGARWLMYRFWVKDSRSWKEGVMLGAGHGGIEAMIIGLMLLATLFQMLVVKDANLASFVEPENLASAEEMVAAYWGSPAWSHFMSLFERVCTFFVHVSMSLMVLQSFTRKNIGWLILSISYHTAVNAVALFIAQSYGIVYSEMAMLGFALISIYIIYRLYKSEPEEVHDMIKSVELLDIKPVDPADNQTIEQSKYE